MHSSFCPFILLNPLATYRSLWSCRPERWAEGCDRNRMSDSKRNNIFNWTQGRTLSRRKGRRTTMTMVSREGGHLYISRLANKFNTHVKYYGHLSKTFLINSMSTKSISKYIAAPPQLGHFWLATHSLSMPLWPISIQLYVDKRDSQVGWTSRRGT